MKLSSEVESWQITATVLLILSASVFVIQRFFFILIDPIFEICIFHLPAMVAIIIYLRKRE
jgi:hypothetical protein